MMKKKITFDEVNGFTDEDGSPIIDSAAGHKIVSACGGSLNPKEMGKLLEALVNAEMITKEEASAVGGAMSPSDDDMPDNAMAADAASVRRRRARRSEAEYADFAARFPDAARVRSL